MGFNELIDLLLKMTKIEHNKWQDHNSISFTDARIWTLIAK